MLSPVLVTAPAAKPYDLVTARLHMRVDGSDEDAVVAAYLDAATGHLDGYAGVLGRALISQSWRQDFDGFGDCLRLPLAPVSAITHVKYYDADNVLQTLSPSAYEHVTDALGSKLVLAYGESWPSTYDSAAPVQVTFVAGYGDAASDVPAALRAAIMMLAAHLYANREAVVVGVMPAELPLGVASLIAPYRRVGL